jgi:hypothetical protein
VVTGVGFRVTEQRGAQVDLVVVEPVANGWQLVLR